MYRYHYFAFLIIFVIFVNESVAFNARIHNARKKPFTAMLVFPKEVMQQKEAALYMLPTIVANNGIPQKTRYLKMYVITSPHPYQRRQRDVIIEQYLNPKLNGNQLRAKRDAVFRRIRPVIKTKRMRYADQMLRASSRSDVISREGPMSATVVFPEEVLLQTQPMLYSLPTIIYNGDESDPRNTRYFYIYVLQSPNQQNLEQPMVMQRRPSNPIGVRRPPNRPGATNYPSYATTTPSYDTKGGVKRPTKRQRFSYGTTQRPFIPRSPPASGVKYRRINTGYTTQNPRVNVATVPPFNFQRVYNSKTQQRKENGQTQFKEDDVQQKVEQQKKLKPPVEAGPPSNNTSDGFDDYDVTTENTTNSSNSTEAAPSSTTTHQPEDTPSKTNDKNGQSKVDVEPDDVKGPTQKKEGKGYKSPSRANKERNKTSKTNGKTNPPKDTQQKIENGDTTPPEGKGVVTQKKETETKGAETTTRTSETKGDTPQTTKPPDSKINDRKDTGIKGGVKGVTQQKQGFKSPVQKNNERKKPSKTNIPKDTQQQKEDNEEGIFTGAREPDGVKGVNQMKENERKAPKSTTKRPAGVKGGPTQTDTKGQSGAKGAVKGQRKENNGSKYPPKPSQSRDKQPQSSKGKKKDDEQQKQVDYDDEQQKVEQSPQGSPEDSNATETTATTTTDSSSATTPITQDTTTGTDKTTSGETTTDGATTPTTDTTKDTTTDTSDTTRETTTATDMTSTSTSKETTTETTTGASTSTSSNESTATDQTSTTVKDAETDTTTGTTTGEQMSTITSSDTTTEVTTDTATEVETTTDTSKEDSSLNGDKPDVVPAHSSLLPSTSTVHKSETAESIHSTIKTTLPYGFQVDADRIADIFSK